MLPLLNEQLYSAASDREKNKQKTIYIDEVTSQNLQPRYDRHFVGITWYNVWS